MGVSVSESKRGKGRRVGKDVNGAPLDLRGELDNRGLLSSLKKQQQDLTVLQDIYKRGGFYAPVLIEVRATQTLLYSTWWHWGDMRAVEEKSSRTRHTPGTYREPQRDQLSIILFLI